MAELVRTNDPGIISVIEGLLRGAEILGSRPQLSAARMNLSGAGSLRACGSA